MRSWATRTWKNAEMTCERISARLSSGGRLRLLGCLGLQQPRLALVFQSVTLALDGNNVGVMKEPVKERCRQGRLLVTMTLSRS